ncbi:hypothetical protein ADIS_4054 [Lunatimonas lonarensis]|uniref:WbqC-like protein n=1 Tax=Lunatimonas lonarensis TaxID=1232681 RepID=R7ZMM3_9BACT|nr:WbqC family protein [Lunatimonas lonarensis]EON75350.1 hypothetical protein ADIS_4054 [Lunatimonas lonarensis]
MMSGVITDLYYLPNLEYFCMVKDFSQIHIQLEDRYVKQSYRNRCEIRLANKVEKLSVPVKEGTKGKPYESQEIDYRQKWVNVHLRGFQSAYGKAPFFEHLFPDLEAVIHSQPRFLWKLNLDLLTICLRFLNLCGKKAWVSKPNQKEGLLDLRGALDAKSKVLDGEYYTPVRYPQVFGLDFVPNLSIVDLLFCMGPDAKAILNLSAKNRLNNT